MCRGEEPCDARMVELELSRGVGIMDGSGRLQNHCSVGRPIRRPIASVSRGDFAAVQTKYCETNEAKEAQSRPHGQAAEKWSPRPLDLTSRSDVPVHQT